MKTLITPVVLDRFLDNYSNDEYYTAWEKLQKFWRDYGDDPRLFQESQFDAEWIDEIFCGVLGYPKKLKGRECWTINGLGRKEERIDGVFYEKDKKTVKIVIELKALDTPNLFKKKGSLSPITQGAKYLFQTKSSELAVVSNFDDFVIFNRKEAYRQSWSLKEITFDEFKEFYLVMSYHSFYKNLTHLMIEQSTKEEKVIDEDFYSLVRSIHRSLHNKLRRPEYANDLFNKFLAMAILEDSSKLPQELIKTVYNRKTDFDQSLRSHWEVFKAFFQKMKRNQASRDYLGINDDISKMNVWQDTSYLGRIKVPKSILDQVVEMSEYNLKSVPLNILFYSIAEYIYNPYMGVYIVDDNDNGSHIAEFKFYSKLFNQYGYVSNEVHFGIVNGKISDNYNHHLIDLYNQLSSEPIEEVDHQKPFLVSDVDYVGKDSWFVIIDPVIISEPPIKSFLKYIESIDIKEVEYNKETITYALLGMNANCNGSIAINNKGERYTMSKSDITDRIIILTFKEQNWLDKYKLGSRKLTDIAEITSEDKANISYDMEYGEVLEKDDMGNWIVEELFDTKKIYIKSDFPDLALMLDSKDFEKQLKFQNMKNLNDAVISKRLMSETFLDIAKKRKQRKESIKVYNFKLNKLKEEDAPAEEIFKVEMMLESLQ